MEHKKIAAIDLDGVLGDLASAFISYVGIDISLEDISKMDMISFLRSRYGYSADAATGTWNSFWDSGTYRQMSVYDGVREALITLIVHGLTVVVLTKRWHWTFHGTYEWLKDNHLPYTSLILDTNKVSWMKQQNDEGKPVDFYIEDDARKAHKAAESDVAKHLYIVDRPWNRDDDISPNVIRVASLPEAVQHYLKSLTKGTNQ